ncbi:SRPBCC domain-containing protein [Phenylobacterium sp.]|uniref:SRPBCC family protein n=1 Tax=Phenylobacterium sp. TaxID=1871053 RepID=UPI002E3566EB|nr:SRPBCC domain-containing protein [Phenylobacterium sp.]HEX3367032.1 SRPBCC domain-containing protein [Phenylobacterium sp.]
MLGSLAVLAFAGVAQAEGSKADLAAVRDTSSIDQTGARLLQDTVRIHAPSAVVWTALTDQAAYRGWAAPVSFIDFRIGGAVEVAFDPKGKQGDPTNLKQQITAYVPGRLIAFRNRPSTVGPPGFAVYPQLAIVIELKPLAGGDTEVALSQVGYGQGKDFDALYGFFKSHNPEYLADLKAFCERPAK